MARDPERLNTPKQFWVTRRTEGYDDWGFAFWKDLFQNAVDAGAKAVNIQVDDAPGRGAFGRAASLDEVVRVRFADNGQGMDEATLRNVFLKPGETTKKGGDFEGGYGTARIMLCFSQVRYAVQTGDMVVEGDGTEYTCQHRDEAIADLRTELAEAVASGDERAPRLQADLDRLEAGSKYVKGCQFEIDIDPKEGRYEWNHMSRDTLLEKLHSYLSMSQLPCAVTVNGEEVSTRSLRGPAKRVLTAQLRNGETLDFGTIHTSMGERAQHKGRLVVRSHGAAMFHEPSQTREQVILELFPAVAKLAMTDNRGGLKAPFREAVQNFVRELAVDATAALKDKEKRQHIEIRGGLGALVARPPGVAPLPDIGDEGQLVLATPKAAKAKLATPEDYRIEGFEGVPRAAIDHLIQAIADEKPTFLERAAEVTGRQGEAETLIAAVREGRGSEALRLVGPELAGAIAATLLTRGDLAAQAERQAEQDRYADMNDVHIRVEDVGEGEAAEKLKNAIRRHKPNFWRREGEHMAGRGMQAHMLLAAWTACCQEAVNGLLAIRPDAAKGGELKFATGFYFEAAKEKWDGRNYSLTRPDAVHQERDGLHVLLVNPVLTDNANPAFDLTKSRGGPGGGPGGVQDLEALAIHEVAHILEPHHDADFANLMTKVAAMFDRTRAHEQMRSAVTALQAVYGKGKSRIQAMDAKEMAPVLEAEPEEAAAPTRGRNRTPRPAEVVLAHAAPVTTMVVGALSARENEHLPADALKEVAGGAVSQTEEGVVEVDCDRVQSLEQRLGSLDFDALITPAAAPVAEAPAAIAGLSSVATTTPAPALVFQALDNLNLGALNLPSVEKTGASPPVPETGGGEVAPPVSGGIDLNALNLPPAGQIWAPTVVPPSPVSVMPDTAKGLDLGALNLPPATLASREPAARPSRQVAAEAPARVPAERPAAAPAAASKADIMAALGSLTGALAAISATPPAVQAPAPAKQEVAASVAPPVTAVTPPAPPAAAALAATPKVRQGSDVEQRAAALIDEEFDLGDFGNDGPTEPDLPPSMGMR